MIRKPGWPVNGTGGVTANEHEWEITHQRMMFVEMTSVQGW